MGRIGRFMRKYDYRVSADAPVVMAAVLEYLCAEILDIAAIECKNNSLKTIKPKHIQHGVRGDEDFARLFQNKSFVDARTTPYINPILLKE